MTAPTVTVTISLVAFGGPAVAGAIVHVKLDREDLYDGSVVVPGSVNATTNASGIATVDIFPNALTTSDPPGLGSTGAIYNVKITPPHSVSNFKTTTLQAVIPNTNCNLDAVVINDGDVVPTPTYQNAIRYDIAQALSSPQQAQARSNIGVDPSGYQPLDSDLTAIAALSTTAYGRAFLVLADAAAGRTALGLGTAATQASTAFDAAGAAAAAQAASQPLDSDLTAIAALTTTSFGRALLALADAAALRTAAGLGTLATQSGTFSGTSSGLNSGDQTISITGDVTASGSTGALAATVTKVNGTSFAALATGILKNTTTTGVPSIAVAADFPTLNQNTTGSAATLTTARSIDGQSFNGSADITVIAPGTHAATSKATPVDADELPLVDSAASNVLKKLTVANLKTYLNSLYLALTSLGTGVATFLATPSSANLAAAITDETGSGALVFGTTPTLTTPAIAAVAYASLPAASGVSGSLARANDLGANGTHVVSNGSRWRPLGGRAVLTHIAAAVAGIAAAETIFAQTLLPVNSWQIGDSIWIYCTLSKSGTTDTVQLTVRIGTAGTTADTALTGLTNFAIMGAAGVSGGFLLEIKLISATSAQKVGAAAANQGSYTVGSSATATSAATTISSAATNPLYVSVSCKSTSTNDTITANSARIELVTP